MSGLVAVLLYRGGTFQVSDLVTWLLSDLNCSLGLGFNDTPRWRVLQDSFWFR